MIQKYNLDSSLVSYIDNLGMGVEARGALGGTVYYVEGNAGKDANSGLSIDTAFKTLAHALAVSHANIAQRSRWAKRNTIYCFGDSFEETLTKFAQKTDIVGLGTCDYMATARLIGCHTPDTGTTLAGSLTPYQGCRWLRFGFKSPAGGGDMFTLTSTQVGIGFIGCDFNADSTIKGARAILATAVGDMTIKDCNFRGAFTDAVIELGAGEANSLLIKDNIISGANMGIDISGSATTSVRASWIIGNYIKSTLACINDASSKFHIVGNRGVTLAAKGSGGAGAFVGSTALSADNMFTASDGSCIWPELELLGA